MLKDITLGQYFPGTTAVHRLDPRTKLLWLIAYIVALFLAKNWASYALMLLVLVSLAAAAHIKPKTLLSGLKPLILIVIFTALINLFYGSGEPLVHGPGGHLSTSSGRPPPRRRRPAPPPTGPRPAVRRSPRPPAPGPAPRAVRRRRGTPPPTP